MRAVLQRVTHASVDVDGEVVGAIDRPGLVALVGVTHDDGPEQVEWLARKIAELRILRDEQSVLDAGAPVLVVSQFTLYADTRKGRRPSWNAAAPGPVAEPLVEAVVAALRAARARGRDGNRFGAMMAGLPGQRRAGHPGRSTVRDPTEADPPMTAFTDFQSSLVLLLGLAALACEVFALVDALRHRADAFVAAGKRTKHFWLILLLVAVVLGVVDAVQRPQHVRPHRLHRRGGLPRRRPAGPAPGRAAAAAGTTVPTARGDRDGALTRADCRP